MKITPRLLLLLGLPAAALIAIIIALLAIGGPSKARLERMDARRISDLSELAGAVERHHIFTGHLPASLAEMTARIEARGTAGTLPKRDPETDAPYAYSLLANDHFRICARLSLPDTPPSAPSRPRIADSDRSLEIVSERDGNDFCLEGILRPG